MSRRPNPQTNLSGAGPLWIESIVLCVVAIVAYGMSWQSTVFMDDANVLAEFVGEDPSPPVTLGLRTTTHLSYYAQFLVGGLNTSFLHFGNFVIHLLNGFLVYLICREIVSRQSPEKFAAVPLIAASLFLSHPLASEIPNYIRARDTALFSMMCGVVLLLLARQPRKWLLFSGLTLAVLLGTLSKHHAAYHMSIALLLGCLFFRKGWLKNWIFWGSLVIPMTLLALSAPHLVRELMKYFSYPELSNEIFTASRVFWSYLGLFLYPDKIVPDRFILLTIKPNMVDWAALFGVFLLVALALFAWRRKQLIVAGSIAWALGHYLFYFIYISGEEMVDYRVYPILPALSLITAIGIVHLVALIPETKLTTGPWKTVFLLIPVAILAILSFRITHRWSSSKNLYQEVVHVEPFNVRAHYALMRAYYGLDRVSEAISAYENLASLMPQFNKANNSYAPNRSYSSIRAYFFMVQAAGFNAQMHLINGNEEKAEQMLILIRDFKLPPHAAEFEEVFSSMFPYNMALAEANRGNYAKAIQWMDQCEAVLNFSEEAKLNQAFLVNHEGSINPDQRFPILFLRIIEAGGKLPTSTLIEDKSDSNATLER